MYYDILIEKLVRLAQKEYPKNAFALPGTVLDQQDRKYFIKHTEKTIDFENLQGYASISYDLTPESYAILLPKVLLAGIRNVGVEFKDGTNLASSQVFATFFSPFGSELTSTNQWLQSSLRNFSQEEIDLLKCAANYLIEAEKEYFGRSVSYLEEVEMFVSYLNGYQRL